MSAPNDGYGQYPSQAYGEQPQYPEQPSEGYANPGSPPPQASAHHAPEHGKKKKRAYAAGAFEVASGPNAGVGLPAGGQPFGAPQPAAPAYGGYPQPEAQPAAYGAVPQPYGAPQPAAPGVGGYQAPEAYYPSAGAPAAAAGGVGGITSGLSSMQLGGQPGVQQPQQLPPQPRPGPLNHLYPTDLLNQPFNVSELDLPPPPIILPPNVSLVRTRRILAFSVLISFLVERHTFSRCKLRTEIRTIDLERRPNQSLVAEEEQTAICAHYPTILRPARFRRSCSRRSRSGNLAMPEMQILHQPIRYLPGPWSPVEV